MAGIYIHIPFCVSKCTYCDFYSIVNPSVETHRSFLRALAQEIRNRAYELIGQDIDTIYIGGGTPSLIPAEEIGRVLSLIRDLHNVSSNAEVTMECNPGDITHMGVEQLLSVGVNRFSIGAQSFQSRLLRFLTRRHSSHETISMVEGLRKAGVVNFSLDLIYGIPGETMDMLRDDLEHLIGLSPTHISAYHLMYEQGTPLTSQLQKGHITELPEEDSLNMFEVVHSTLSHSGYEHYEVSNYARSGYRSRHNSSYWQEVPYQGLGPSAHSYSSPWRSWNPSSVHRYIQQLLTGGRFLTRDFEYITPDMSYMEYILTHLRTVEGLSLTHIRDTYGEHRFRQLTKSASPLINRGMLQLRGDALALTASGLLVSDSIIEKLV